MERHEAEARLAALDEKAAEQLSGDEQAFAAMCGMSAADYLAHKDRHPDPGAVAELAELRGRVVA